MNEEYEKLARTLEEKISEGQKEAVYYLGCLYFSGKGVEKDYKRALTIFQNAVDNGNLKAMYVLGKWYEEGGHGIRKNGKKVDQYVNMKKRAITQCGMIALFLYQSVRADRAVLRSY